MRGVKRGWSMVVGLVGVWQGRKVFPYVGVDER